MQTYLLVIHDVSMLLTCSVRRASSVPQYIFLISNNTSPVTSATFHYNTIIPYFNLITVPLMALSHRDVRDSECFSHDFFLYLVRIVHRNERCGFFCECFPHTSSIFLVFFLNACWSDRTARLVLYQTGLFSNTLRIYDALTERFSHVFRVKSR